MGCDLLLEDRRELGDLGVVVRYPCVLTLLAVAIRLYTASTMGRRVLCVIRWAMIESNWAPKASSANPP